MKFEARGKIEQTQELGEKFKIQNSKTYFDVA